MRVVSRVLESRSGRINLEPLGDTHVGSVAFVRDKMLDRVDEIRNDKDRYWIGMGDYIDNVRPWRKGALDRRWELNSLKGNANWLEQWDEFVDIVKPIKHKCLGLLWGNHEWASLEEQEFERMVEKDLGVEFLGSRAFLFLRISGKFVKKKDWTVLAVHGDFAGDTKGGALNRVKQLSQTIVANIYLYAHTHFKSVDKGERVYVNVQAGKVEVVREPVISVLTGGFVDPYCLGVDTYYDRKPRGRDIRVGTVTVIIDAKEVKLYAAE